MPRLSKRAAQAFLIFAAALAISVLAAAIASIIIYGEGVRLTPPA